MYLSEEVPGGADGPHLENHCLRSLKTIHPCEREYQHLLLMLPLLSGHSEMRCTVNTALQT